MCTIDENFVAEDSLELESEILIQLDVSDIGVESVDVDFLEPQSLDAVLNPQR
jgi:hypothetical protein